MATLVSLAACGRGHCVRRRNPLRRYSDAHFEGGIMKRSGGMHSAVVAEQTRPPQVVADVIRSIARIFFGAIHDV